MRIFILTIVFLFINSNVYASNVDSSKVQTDKRVAVLISSYGEKGRENLSYSLEELAQVFLILQDNGVNIDIISPKGGPVLVKTHNDHLDYIQRFKQKTSALAQLKSTIASKDAKFENYDGIFVIGGDGSMFDLPFDADTQKLITYIANKNMPIAAVCHGPAALVNIKLANGKYLVDGKKVNGFTNAEESAFGGPELELFSFLLEDKLKERGGYFFKNAPLLSYVAVDENLITAQNPSATGKATEALVMKLGLSVKPRILFKDEAAMALIDQARSSGAYLIDIAMSAEPELYDLFMMTIYGIFSYELAKTEDEKQRELEIMEVIGNYVSHPKFHPMYLTKLATAQWEQGFKEKAKNTLEKLKDTFPEHKGIEEVTALISG